MQSLHKQAGLTAMGWLLAVLLATFVGLFGFKVGSAYIDNAFVVSTLKKIGKDESVNKLSTSKIKSNILKQFVIDGVNDNDIISAVSVKKTSKGKLITINYEKRENFFRNIDLVIVFNNELDTANPDACCGPAK